jgi:hypothetical protein
MNRATDILDRISTLKAKGAFALATVVRTVSVTAAKPARRRSSARRLGVGGLDRWRLRAQR